MKKKRRYIIKMEKVFYAIVATIVKIYIGVGVYVYILIYKNVKI